MEEMTIILMRIFNCEYKWTSDRTIDRTTEMYTCWPEKNSFLNLLACHGSSN
jgi:hypothetical protein